jgi:chromosome segregation ATPase
MSAAKVDLKAMEAALAKLDKRIKANADQDKSTLAATERINQQLLAAIDKNNSDVKAVSGQIKKEFRLFKEEFDARLLELSAYEQRIVQLTKDTSRLAKQLDKLKQDTAASMDKKVGLLKQDLEKRIAEVKRRAEAAHLTAKKAAADAAKSPPQAQSTTSPKASSSPVSPTPTPNAQAPEVPTGKVPGTGGISVQDLSQ